MIKIDKKKIDLYNLHKDDEKLPMIKYQYPNIYATEKKEDVQRIMEEIHDKAKWDNDTYYDPNNRNVFNDTFGHNLDMYGKGSTDTYRNNTIDLENTHLDDLFFDFDTYKIYKVDNPKLELGYPTTDKGYLHIFNRYKVDRLTRFYFNTGYNYNIPFQSFFDGNIVAEKKDKKPSGEPIQLSFTDRNGVQFFVSDSNYYRNNLILRKDRIAKIHKIGYHKFLGDTDCIVQMYVTAKRTYFRSSNSISTIRFFESLGAINLNYDFLQSTDPKYKLDGKALIWGASTSHQDKSIDSPLFLDDDNKYTIKRPTFRNSDPGNVANFDIPNYNFLPKGLIFTEAGFFRDGFTSDEELKANLQEYNDLWKLKPGNDKITVMNITVNEHNPSDGRNHEVNDSDKNDYINYDIIKDVNKYVNLPKIPDSLYPSATFILEGNLLKEYFNTLGNLYTSPMVNLYKRSPYSEAERKQNSSALQLGSGSIRYFRPRGEFLQRSKAIVTFMEAAKQGYPLQSAEAKNLLKRDRNYLDWSNWTHFYYPDSDRHTKANNYAEDVRYNMSVQDIKDAIYDKFKIREDYSDWLSPIKDDFYKKGENVDLSQFVNKSNLSSLSQNSNAFHSFINNINVNAIQFEFRINLASVYRGYKKPADTRYSVSDAGMNVFAYAYDYGWALLSDNQLRTFLQSKSIPRVVNRARVHTDDPDATFENGDEIIYTDFLRWNLLFNRQNDELPSNHKGIHLDNLNYQSFTIPSDNWNEIYIDVVEYINNKWIPHVRLYVANIPDIPTWGVAPGIELLRENNTFKLIRSEDSPDSYMREEYFSFIFNTKNIYIKKVWWR